MKQSLEHAKATATRAWRSAVLLLVLLLLSIAPAFAQGCAMCYTTAAAASKDGQMAIDRAVAVLLAPPLGFMTLGVGLAFRYGRKRDREHTGDESDLCRLRENSFSPEGNDHKAEARTDFMRLTRP